MTPRWFWWQRAGVAHAFPVSFAVTPCGLRFAGFAGPRTTELYCAECLEAVRR